MKKLLVLLSLAMACFASEINYAKPLPSFDSPRRIILQVNHDGDKILSGVLNNITNIMAAYGPEMVNIKVVAFADGIIILQEKGNPFYERIKGMMDLGVEFVACGKTMETRHLGMKDMIKGVSYVQTGLTEVIERQQEGWIYVRP